VNDERARLFVALELPEEVRAAIVRWRACALGGELAVALAPVAAESLHVTLCFLGAVPVGSVGAIGDACATAVAGEGTDLPLLALGEPVWLPPRRPRVLGVMVCDPSLALARVQAALSRALADGGWYQPETRPFLAHATAARAGREQRLRAVTLPAPPAMGFEAERVTLFRSRLGAGGARYEPLRVVDINRARPPSV
jgi:RNA 2',3'-cyclic 3'-phosphodiesterase